MTRNRLILIVRSRMKTRTIAITEKPEFRAENVQQADWAISDQSSQAQISLFRHEHRKRRRSLSRHAGNGHGDSNSNWSSWLGCRDNTILPASDLSARRALESH